MKVLDLTDCEKRYGGIRPHSPTVAHMGWAGKPLTYFMPHQADTRVRFNPTLDQEGKSKPFLEPKGTPADWVAGMTQQRPTSPAFRTMLAASLASVLVTVVDIQTFIIYLWGTLRGSDTDLKAIRYVADWLARNEMHFSETCEDDRLERYGAIEQHKDGLGFDWLVISSALTDALNRGNYDRTKTLARMFDEGIVAAGTKGYVRQRRIGESAHRTYCVVIDNNALEKFVADHAPRLTGSPKAGWR